MTEGEWLACEEPGTLVSSLRNKDDRKLRLFFCGSCRSIWPFADRPILRRAVELGELFADGLVTADELAVLRQELRPGPYYSGDKVNATAWGAVSDGFPVWAISDAADLQLAFAAKVARDSRQRTLPPGTKDAIRRSQVLFIRCVFGNPFHPVAFSPEWRTDTVLTLARQMYDERDFSAMPILADALQDVECNNEEVLNHCRGPGPHVRGCWVVDLVLGRK